MYVNEVLRNFHPVRFTRYHVEYVRKAWTRRSGHEKNRTLSHQQMDRVTPIEILARTERPTDAARSKRRTTNRFNQINGSLPYARRRLLLLSASAFHTRFLYQHRHFAHALRRSYVKASRLRQRLVHYYREDNTYFSWIEMKNKKKQYIDSSIFRKIHKYVNTCIYGVSQSSHISLQ